MRPRSHRTWLLVALTLVVLVRLPALINAGDVNSDAAIVGLQARHFAQGEWTWTLWGAPYQLAIEAFLLAPVAGLLGRFPVLLLMPPLVGMLLMVALVWRVLARTLSPLSVLACVLPLIFGTHAIGSPMVFVMRQVMVTVAVAGVALLYFAAIAQKSAPSFFAGTAVVGSAALIDAFGLVLFPAAAVLGVGLALTSARGHRRRALVRALFALGGLAFVSSQRRSLGNDPYSWAFYKWLFGERHALLTDECLPFALGLKSYLLGSSAQWLHPAPLRPLLFFSVALFVLLLLSPLVLIFVRRLDAHLRVLGLFGTTAALSAVGAFVLRGDSMWAVRYLAPILWFAPFALAPAVTLLGARLALPVVGLWAVFAGSAGWATWGSYVTGPAIVLSAHARLDDERALRAELERRGVRAAWADYWQAYRLTLLFDEQIVVAPLNPSQDRYPAYRIAAEQQRPRAMIFEAGDPRLDAEASRRSAKQQGVLRDAFTIGRYTVLLLAN